MGANHNVVRSNTVNQRSAVDQSSSIEKRSEEVHVASHEIETTEEPKTKQWRGII
jgi:hypothetical protein